jgi:putative transposase
LTCSLLGYARSTYYKQVRQIKKKQKSHSEILNYVHSVRQVMPKLGVRKLHDMLHKSVYQSNSNMLGRDQLFKLLRKNNLLIVRKRKYAITTDSKHPYRVYKNLILSEIITRPNQVWVSDITYIRTASGFSYLSLVTDLYSRKIVGYYASNSLELTGCVKALKMALKNGNPMIHHSDRGSQYCSHEYTSILKKYDIKISMTENGNCYENAVAERMNGILKQEFNLNATFANLNHVQKAVIQAVEIYNKMRPSWALNLKTPDQVYLAAK